MTETIQTTISVSACIRIYYKISSMTWACRFRSSYISRRCKYSDCYNTYRLVTVLWW